jgi:hypothetical protein
VKLMGTRDVKGHVLRHITFQKILGSVVRPQASSVPVSLQHITSA